MTDDKLTVLGDFTYEHTPEGWFEIEPADPHEGIGAYWVGPPLDDPQLIAALTKIEELEAEMAGCPVCLTDEPIVDWLSNWMRANVETKVKYDANGNTRPVGFSELAEKLLADLADWRSAFE